MMEYCADHFSDAKPDLATVFLDRCMRFLQPNSACAVVTPHNWLFLSQYEEFRKRYLKSLEWNLLARLGSGAFATISGEVVKAALIVLTNKKPTQVHEMMGLDVSELPDVNGKSNALRSDKVSSANQANQFRNPDARVVLGYVRPNVPQLTEIAECYQGLVTGDRERFVRCFWEVAGKLPAWEYFKSSSDENDPYAGQQHILFWQRGKGELAKYAALTRDRLHDMHESGNRSWGKAGVAVGRMTLRASLYQGEPYDNNLAVITPNNPKHLPALWAFCSSDEFALEVRRLDQKLNLTNATVIKVPFDLARWTAVAETTSLPEAVSTDPTNWLFQGVVPGSADPLQVAVARLLGYRWPEQPKEADAIDKLADKDGIVCIPAVRGQAPSPERLLEVLRAAYGQGWTAALLDKLLTDAGCKAGTTLDDWLRNQFFEQHCKLFHHRPFIWHIWDGRRDGFSCLVNYHKLNHKTLENLTYAFLQDWITVQANDAKENRAGADLQLNAAQELQDKLKLILAGEKPYDIFVRWKPLEEQPIGWNPDLNDGVRMNIRPFTTAEVLRKAPNIKWTKDRGKDPESAPWYEVFGGDRINDHRLTIAEKQAAREKAGK
jgi:hypothetical protein